MNLWHGTQNLESFNRLCVLRNWRVSFTLEVILPRFRSDISASAILGEIILKETEKHYPGI